MLVSVVVRLDIFSADDPLTPLIKCEIQCARITVFPTSGGLGATSLNYHPRLDKSLMTQATIEALSAGRKFIVLRERADYVDGAGTEHATVSCLFYVTKKLGFGAFTSCPGGSGAT